jgi:hypothetical protein
MKKRAKLLRFSKETLRNLQASDLLGVLGGTACTHSDDSRKVCCDVAKPPVAKTPVKHKPVRRPKRG